MSIPNLILPFLSVLLPLTAFHALGSPLPDPFPSSGLEGYRIFVSVDMEGLAGAVTGEQLSPSGFEYQRFRQFMTDEALAAIAGAREAGATSFVVADAHGNGQNLLIEQFPPDVEVVRSWPRELGMMGGLDDSFDAAFFIGYHSGATNFEGVRAHTLSSAHFASVVLNGHAVPEGGLNAALAGHFGVPVALVSGDNATVTELRDLLGDVEGVVVKEALGFHSAQTLTPAAAQERIRAGARRAVERISDFQPYQLDGPPVLDLTFKNYRPAEVLSYLSIVERTAARTLRFRGSDMVEVSKFLQFVGNYEPGLSP